MKYWEKLEKEAKLENSLKNNSFFASLIEEAKKSLIPVTETVKAFQDQRNAILGNSEIKLDPSLFRGRDYYVQERLQRIESILSKPKNKNVIVLTKDGTLKLGKLSYRMKSAKKRVAILRILRRRSIATQIIKDATGSISCAAVRKSIGQINNGAIFKLGLKYPLIESKGEGYYINPRYKFEKK